MRRLRVGRWPLVLLAACSREPTGPPLAFCPTSAAPTVLQPTEYTAVNPAASDGCVVFPANALADTAEYLLVPQATTETPNLSSSFKLAGSAVAAAAPAIAAALQAAPLSPAEQFHARLRELERTRGYGAPGVSAAPGAPALGAQVVPATVKVGDTVQFKVLNTTTALTVDNVTAVAQAVGQHVAIFVDTGAPKPALSPFDIDTLRTVFETKLYPADTLAFGRESDIDGNGLVIVLMTNTVNKMVAKPCANGFVAGFFFGGDIDPTFHSQFNSAEIFYTIVADPGGTLSCAHTVANVKRGLPPTLVHEFQHMISYNQHVLVRRGDAEVLWLNEAMSHYAEERGGRAFLPDADSSRFCPFVQGDLANFGSYVSSPGNYALLDTSGIGGLAERGEWWSFVRYLVDQFGDTALAAADAFTRRIDQTAELGAVNLTQVTGTSFATLVERWALANWVSDAPNFAAPAELQYKQWAFRSAYPAMNRWCNVGGATFPITAQVSAPTDVSVSGTIRSGSGAAYQRVLQAPGGSGFRVLFSDNAGRQLPLAVAPRLNVIRIR